MRHVPRAKVTSRTVTVRQYRTEAQYVPMAEANGMRANHVSGTPFRDQGQGGGAHEYAKRDEDEK
jgi:hypothetical protein